MREEKSHTHTHSSLGPNINSMIHRPTPLSFAPMRAAALRSLRCCGLIAPFHVARLKAHVYTVAQTTSYFGTSACGANHAGAWTTRSTKISVTPTGSGERKPCAKRYHNPVLTQHRGWRGTKNKNTYCISHQGKGSRKEKRKHKSLGTKTARRSRRPRLLGTATSGHKKKRPKASKSSATPSV